MKRRRRPVSNQPAAVVSTPAAIPAGFLRRMAALVYDAILLAGTLFGATFAALAFRGGEAFRPHDPWFTGYLAAVSLLFFGWFWTHGGQTLGMRAWKIRLITADGAPMTWRRAVIRGAIAAPSAALLGLGYIWMLFDSQRRSWHDRASKTRIVLCQTG